MTPLGSKTLAHLWWLGIDSFKVLFLKTIFIVQNSDFTYSGPRIDMNDIALIKTLNEIELNKNVKPICITNYIYSEPESRVATVAGFGRLSSDGPLATRLQKLQMNIIPQDECQEMLAPNPIHSSHLCLRKKDQTTCYVIIIVLEQEHFLRLIEEHIISLIPTPRSHPQPQIHSVSIWSLSSCALEQPRLWGLSQESFSQTIFLSDICSMSRWV